MTVLVTMQTVSAALYLQKLWQGACQVVPVPRLLSSSCGYAAEVELVDGKEATALEGLMNRYALEWECIYMVALQNGEPAYQALAHFE